MGMRAFLDEYDEETLVDMVDLDDQVDPEDRVDTLFSLDGTCVDYHVHSDSYTLAQAIISFRLVERLTEPQLAAVRKGIVNVTVKN